MNIRAKLKTSLNSAELNQAKLLFNRTPYSAGIQNPELPTVIGKNTLHVLIYENDNFSMIGYVLVEVKRKILATISFGPLCTDENSFPMLATACIKMLLDYGIKIIRYQPPFIQLPIWETSLNHLQQKFTSFSLPSEINWSTLILDISPSEDDLIKSFTGKLRWHLKKAISQELFVEQATELKDINGFAEGFCKMYEARNLPNNLEVERERLKALFAFTVEKRNGFILTIKKESQLLGGAVLIRHNNTTIYLLGYSDPEHKNLPIHHSLFLKAFEIAKLSGCTYFDFGGYARPKNADEQLLKINKFKDGFRGKRIDHPDTILFAKNRFYKFLYINFVRFFKAK